MRIALVEDDALTRTRIAQLLRACLPQAHLTLFDRRLPAEAFATLNAQDYWLVDLGLPDGSGVDLIRAIRTRYANAHILVISVFGDVDNVVGSIQAGANGYLLKDAVDKDLMGAIEAIELGGTPLSPMIASRLLENLRAAPVPEAPTPHTDDSKRLTAKETELLNLLCRGYTYSETAELMTVSLSTVQTHVRRIYAKLAVSSRAEAVFEAKSLGLLQS